LNNNPLRLLDSKKDNIKDILEKIPTMSETLSSESKNRFNVLLDKLDDMKIDYILDNSIVRGLDYYNDTVFEWRDTSLGSQNAVCAGGRYDSLVQNTGGNDVPAIGFAMGIERIIELLKNIDISFDDQQVIIPIISTLDETESYAVEIATNLRHRYPCLSFYATDSSASLSSQTKSALKINDNFIIMITNENIKNKSITVRMKENKMNDTILTNDELIKLMDESYG